MSELQCSIDYPKGTDRTAVVFSEASGGELVVTRCIDLSMEQTKALLAALAEPPKEKPVRVFKVGSPAVPVDMERIEKAIREIERQRKCVISAPGAWWAGYRDGLFDAGTIVSKAALGQLGKPPCGTCGGTRHMYLPSKPPCPDCRDTATPKPGENDGNHVE